MNYKELKMLLVDTILKVEEVKDNRFDQDGYTLEEVKIDLIQYMVFFEEIEKKEKKINKEDFIDDYRIIYEYLKEVSNILKS